jgi:outer membrane protein TolC
MTFQAYFKSLSKDEKADLARRAKTSVKQLEHLAQGRRRAGLDLGIRLKRADPAITDELLRPDLFPAA